LYSDINALCCYLACQTTDIEDPEISAEETISIVEVIEEGEASVYPATTSDSPSATEIPVSTVEAGESLAYLTDDEIHCSSSASSSMGAELVNVYKQASVGNLRDCLVNWLAKTRAKNCPRPLTPAPHFELTRDLMQCYDSALCTHQTDFLSCMNALPSLEHRSKFAKLYNDVYFLCCHFNKEKEGFSEWLAKVKFPLIS